MLKPAYECEFVFITVFRQPVVGMYNEDLKAHKAAFQGDILACDLGLGSPFSGHS